MKKPSLRRHHYSGPNSKKFWARINAIKDIELHDLIYTMGCMLQNIEEHVLRELKELEDD